MKKLGLRGREGFLPHSSRQAAVAEWPRKTVLAIHTDPVAPEHLGSCTLFSLTLGTDDGCPPGTFTPGSILFSRKPLY